MAKAVITLEDTNDGTVSAQVEFDPPVDDVRTGHDSPAQMSAVLYLNWLDEQAAAVQGDLFDG